jgi:hypothetical protein
VTVRPANCCGSLRKLEKLRPVEDRLFCLFKQLEISEPAKVSRKFAKKFMSFGTFQREYTNTQTNLVSS